MFENEICRRVDVESPSLIPHAPKWAWTSAADIVARFSLVPPHDLVGQRVAKSLTRCHTPCENLRMLELCVDAELRLATNSLHLVEGDNMRGCSSHLSPRSL